MISMNDIVSIKMTLTKATILRSVLFTAAYDLREIDPEESKRLSEFEKLIQSQLDQLDFSENEKLVDDINTKIAKEANE